MPLPHDYAERVYAGVLGKLIGVYLGRPFEGWTYERITERLGEVWYYVHGQLGQPLVVTDDDITGTFTFLRALPDYGCDPGITPEQVGQTWLNYIIENRTILWWGGMGRSTEHTTYLRLKSGIRAPASGSAALNGEVIAEQIGAQIFIDGWGLVCPGDPERAADLARRAASVSHDGEAIYGAQVVAAIEALAFVEPDIGRLLDTAVALIPRDSVINRLIADLREWRSAEPDWRRTRERIVERYGYDRYGGNCHMVPNHALIIHALLYGDGDFQRSLMIVNTCGWDTDCNSGNVGCILGIRNGLAGIDTGPDWRGPVADRMYLPTADGGRAVTDAVTEAVHIANVGRALAGLAPEAPRGGARYHFSLPGSVQGFVPEDALETRGVVVAENAADGRGLVLRYRRLATGRAARVAAATFIPPGFDVSHGYALIASPSIYPGQRLRARLSADEANTAPVTCRLYLRVYDASDGLAHLYGPEVVLAPGAGWEPAWTVPDTSGYPIAEVGVELTSSDSTDGNVYLDWLTWDGAPDVRLRRSPGGTAWLRAWVNGVDTMEACDDGLRVIHNQSTGLAIQGCREWTDYTVSAPITVHMASAAGIAARVQGMRRYYALLLCAGSVVRLVKALDGDTVLAEAAFDWQPGTAYELSLRVVSDRIAASIDGREVFAVRDAERPLTGGAVALVITEGHMQAGSVRMQPA